MEKQSICVSTPLLTALSRDTAPTLKHLSLEEIRKPKWKEETIAHHREHIKIQQLRSYIICRKSRYELGGVSVSLLKTS